jgi:hypothetical protein
MLPLLPFLSQSAFIDEINKASQPEKKTGKKHTQEPVRYTKRYAEESKSKKKIAKTSRAKNRLSTRSRKNRQKRAARQHHNNN